MAENRIILWYRNDLRLHDHEPLVKATESGAKVIPVYCFDDRQFGKSSFGFAKTGAFRAQFLLESVADLRRSLRSLGSELVVRSGLPELEVAKLAQELEASAVYFHQEVTPEETQVERALEKVLAQLNISIKTFWGQTLYHRNDLPFSVGELPEIFTNFRKQIEQSCKVQPMLPSPQRLAALPESIDPGEIPTLEKFGLTMPNKDSRQQIEFTGGETAGLDRVREYIWQRDRLKVYKETRNGMLEPDDSTKFSPWLAIGALSPRYLYWQVNEYEEKRVRNDSTYWLVFELLWRDYFRFVCAKHGSKLFRVEGLQGVKVPWKQDWPRFELWCAGETGFPLVDASMQELAATGFMSNRGRQNVGSFLTKNLGIDWRMGAEYFESLLIDYDVCSNWGNWNYTAGVGNDARGFRFFNITKQSKDYDPQGDYAKHWLPRLGVDYPEPIVDLFQSAQSNERIYNAAFGIVKREKDDRSRPTGQKGRSSKPNIHKPCDKSR
jgi:deoxyribodipyrimidine photo-lyase